MHARNICDLATPGSPTCTCIGFALGVHWVCVLCDCCCMASCTRGVVPAGNGNLKSTSIGQELANWVAIWLQAVQSSGV